MSAASFQPQQPLPPSLVQPHVAQQQIAVTQPPPSLAKRDRKTKSSKEELNTGKFGGKYKRRKVDDPRLRICDICNRDFVDIYQHLDFHVDIIPERCQLCERKITNRAYLVRFSTTDKGTLRYGQTSQLVEVETRKWQIGQQAEKTSQRENSQEEYQQTSFFGNRGEEKQPNSSSL